MIARELVGEMTAVMLLDEDDTMADVEIELGAVSSLDVKIGLTEVELLSDLEEGTADEIGSPELVTPRFEVKVNDVGIEELGALDTADDVPAEVLVLDTVPGLLEVGKLSKLEDNPVDVDALVETLGLGPDNTDVNKKIELLDALADKVVVVVIMLKLNICK